MGDDAYTSAWQRHLANACLPDCCYCVMANKTRRRWHPVLHHGPWTTARAQQVEAQRAKEAAEDKRIITV